ncbi:MAG: hypothetical protein HUJ97_05990 [Bacteroidales bacterium]|nr:hypothetical protein [Bacteroidales bacterium]
MKKILTLMCATALMLCMSSCGKKLQPLTADNFTCNPSPLVEVGGKVNATITVTYPEKYFQKKAILTVTPVLVYATGETASYPVVFQGEKVIGNDNQVSYKYGGNATFKAMFNYTDEMANSKLYLDFKAETGSKVYTLPRIAIADGVIATESLSTAANATPAYGNDNFVRDTFDKYVAKLIYQVNSSNLRSSETKKEEMKNVEDIIKATKDEERRQFEGIEMISTASPEGKYELNEKLANSREGSSTKYLQQMLKKAKMEGSITPEQVAENWEGFKELVEKSNMQDKSLILAVLARISDPEQREKEIKNLSAAYKELADDILPQLRYSQVTATVKNIGHTDDEILALANNDSKALSLEELLYAATLVNDTKKKEEILNIAAKNFPEDSRAKNNIADLKFKAGKIDEATKIWNDIVSKNPNMAEANMNLGLSALNSGDLQKAAQYLGKAGNCSEYGEAMGTLLTQQGNYDAACQSFGDVKSNNAAVAQICANNLSKAKSILDAVKDKDAMTYYLAAIVGARTNNSNEVSSNLAKAVSMDSALKTKAANDLEFSKFASVVAGL